MKNTISKLALLVLTGGLVGCSGNMPSFSHLMSGNSGQNPEKQQGIVGTTMDKEGQQKNVNITMSGGGDIGLKSMDAQDTSKMSHALDAGLGKATHWENAATGINYTVTPTRKVEVNGNPFCRQYNVQVSRGSTSKDFNGTACVTTDGSWHTV